MATRKPVVYDQGLLTELPSDYALAGTIVPNSTPSPTLATMLPGELAIDSTTWELVIRIGDLVWRFQAGGVSSFVGKLDFSQARNSHWIGTGLV